VTGMSVFWARSGLTHSNMIGLWSRSETCRLGR